jgi:diacylglycerol kinase (ATP)
MIKGDQNKGLNRIARASLYSWQGLKSAWREESAFRQEVALSAVLIPAGLHFGRSGIERAALIGPMILVLVVELLNSSLEAVVDRVGTERDYLAAMAKDMGSAAVMLSLLSLITVWFLILSGR